jgi:hypothetical protein
MSLLVEQFLELEIINRIIENLDAEDLVDVMEQALDVEDLDFTLQREAHYEVFCTSHKERIDSLNQYLRDEAAEAHEYNEKDSKEMLHNQLFQFCLEYPEKKGEMLRDQLCQISTLKAYNALARQIWALSAEERDKLGDDALYYFRYWGPSEVDAMYWPPVQW